MRSRDQRRPPLPAGLPKAEREFFLELRRLVDIAGFTCRTLEEFTSTVRSASGDSCFFSKSQWGRWLNAQSLPPRKAVKRLVERLVKDDVDGGHLLDLWIRAFVPSADDPGQDEYKLVRPRQLPPIGIQFVGRAQELELLSKLVDKSVGENSAAIIVISGTAGVGKTTLANHLGRCVGDRFADGQLYINLRSFGPAGEPLTAHAALRSFLDALGVPPNAIPVGPDDQASFYRGLIADKRLLIVLDNARDLEQVRPLLPRSPGCLVLVTSRNELTGLVAEGAHALCLEPFSLDDARTLLSRRLTPERVDKEPHAATELIEVCARLPLAVSVAAAHAAARPEFPLTAFVGELRKRGLDLLDTGDPATTTRTVFNWSYHHLSRHAALVFRLLGVHPGPDTSVAATASLCAVPRDQAYRTLHELSREHLVEEHTPGRFAFHDLLRAYAVEQARRHETDADRRAAECRLLDHYLHTGHPGRRLLSALDDDLNLPQPQPGVAAERLITDVEAMAWFRAEHHALLAAVTDAADRGFDAHCWQLAWVIAPYLVRGGYWHDFAATQRIALAAARRSAHPVARAHVQWELGHACALLGNVEEAESHVHDALATYVKLRHRTGEAKAKHGLSALLEQQGRYEEALPLALEALQLNQSYGSATAIGLSQNAVGWLCVRLGYYNKAARYCRDALEILEQAGLRPASADALDTLGLAYARSGSHAQAILHYQKAIAIYREIGSLPGAATTLTYLGDVQFEAGNLAASRESWERALEIIDGLQRQDAEPVKARLSHGRGYLSTDLS